MLKRGLPLWILLICLIHYTTTKGIILYGTRWFDPCKFNVQGVLNCSAVTPPLNEMPTIYPVPEKVQSFILDNSAVTNIPNYAFYYVKADIKSVFLRNSQIKTIETLAFAQHDVLTHITITNVDSFRPTSMPNIDLAKIFYYIKTLKTLHLERIHVQRIAPHSFADKGIEELVLTDTNTILIEKGAFLGYAASTLKRLVITNNPNLGKISNVTLFLDGVMNLQELDLTNTGLTGNCPSLPTANALQTLRLSSNQLSAIPRWKLKLALQNLYLDNNNFVHNSLPGLVDVPRIKILDLSGNLGIEKIPVEIKKLRFLTNLYMRKTALKQIMMDDFFAHTKLKVLDISETSLFIVQSEAFEELPSLEILVLNNIRLAGVHVDKVAGNWTAVFQKAINLKYLRIKRCFIDDTFWVHLQALASRTMFRFLSMELNQITTIPHGFFTKFPQLTSLNLEGNRISALNSQSLLGIPYDIQHLILANNQLRTIDSCSIPKVKNYAKINIQGNPLVCDCRLRWMLSLPIQPPPLPPTPLFTFDFKCASPTQYAGIPFRNLTVDQLICSPGQTIPQCNTTNTPGPISTEKPIGEYYVIFKLTYYPDNTSIVLSNINVLRYASIFDHFTVDYTKTKISSRYAVVNYIHPMTRTVVVIESINPGTQYEFCIILWRGQERNKFAYNCQSTSILETSKLTTSALAGIVIGAIATVVVIVLAILLVCKHHQSKKERRQTTQYLSQLELSYNKDNTYSTGVAGSMSRLYEPRRASSRSSLAQIVLRPNSQTSTMPRHFSRVTHSTNSLLGATSTPNARSRSRSVDQLDMRSPVERLKDRRLPTQPKSQTLSGNFNSYINRSSSNSNLEPESNGEKPYDTLEGEEYDYITEPRYLAMSEGADYLDMSRTSLDKLGAEQKPPPLPPPRITKPSIYDIHTGDEDNDQVDPLLDEESRRESDRINNGTLDSNQSGSIHDLGEF